jgi:hypothetical protein
MRRRHPRLLILRFPLGVVRCTAIKDNSALPDASAAKSARSDFPT